MFKCNRCKELTEGWTVPDSEWYQLPKKFHKKALCQVCFIVLSGIKNPKYLTTEEEYEKEAYLC